VTAIAAAAQYSLALVTGAQGSVCFWHPRTLDSVFKASFPSRSGQLPARIQNLAYRCLVDALPTHCGNGGTSTISDSTSASAQRFYRLGEW